jgi:hypothetical protein
LIVNGTAMLAGFNWATRAKTPLARRSIRRDPILPAPLSIVSDRRAPPVPGKIGRYEIAALLAGPSLTS